MHGKNHSRSKTGTNKSKSGGGSVAVTKTKARQCSNIDDSIMHLRAAIFDTDGSDKDVCAGLAPALMKYNKNGLDLCIEFSTRLSKEDAEWAFGLVQENMEEKYDASGYGWDDDDKYRELTEKGTRFLVAREWPAGDEEKGEPVAFAHFRFTVQGEVIDQMAGEASLHIFDIHVEEHSQRKGLGKHLITLLELIARRENMRLISIPVQLEDDETEAWLMSTKRGFEPDKTMSQLGFDSQMEGFEMFSKVFPPKVVTPAAAAAAKADKAVAQEVALKLAVKMAGATSAPPAPPTSTASSLTAGAGPVSASVSAKSSEDEKKKTEDDVVSAANVAPPVAPSSTEEQQQNNDVEKKSSTNAP